MRPYRPGTILRCRLVTRTVFPSIRVGCWTVRQRSAPGRGRMTAQRRDVLGLILQADAPVGAYDLLEQLRVSDRRPAPPTVYRALDFLLEHGLIHRIERLSAFVPCAPSVP